MTTNSHMMSKVRCRCCNHDWYEIHRRKIDTKFTTDCPNCERRTPVKILIDFAQPAQAVRNRIGVHLVVEQKKLPGNAKYNLAVMDTLVDLGFISALKASQYV